MVVVALAHLDEVKAQRELEHALLRMSATSLIGRKFPDGVSWESLRRRAIAARVAYRQAFEVVGARRARHSRWYRAYLRARS